MFLFFHTVVVSLPLIPVTFAIMFAVRSSIPLAAFAERNDVCTGSISTCSVILRPESMITLIQAVARTVLLMSVLLVCFLVARLEDTNVGSA